MRKKFLLMFLVLSLFTSMGGGHLFAQNGNVAKIGDTGYATFNSALTAANGMTGDVTVEIYEKVTLNSSLSGSYSSIKFVGKDTDAEIYLDVQGYITATGKNVAFEDLTLSKSEGGFIGNAGFMNVAFGVYDVTEVTYTNCVFANGACASSGKVTYTDCTFKKSWDKYGLWAYGNVDITVDGCTFDDYRGIKMYAEGAAKTVDLTVKNTDFSAVNNKPAIVLTYGESVTLEGNTYSSTGTFELDLDGQPNGTAVTSDVAPTCQNDNGACGVLVDGKIYTTVAQAAEVAQAGSTVTLLHNSTETVELPAGVTLNKNGHEAAGITVTQPVAKIGDAEYFTLQAAINAVQDGETITLVDNVTISAATAAYNDGTYIDGVRYTGDKSFTVDFNGKTVTDDGCVNDYLIYINNKGEKASEITFTNGTIVSKNGCWSAVCVNSSAATQNVVLNLNGMNITNSNDAEYSGNPVVRARNLATVNVNDGTTITSNGASYGVAANTDGSTININEGSTIVQQNSGTTGGNSVFAAVGGKGVINIKGGTITSDRYGVHTMTTGTPVINISGGTITAPVALKSSTNGGNGELATINVTGGTINGKLETYTDNGKIVVSGGTFSEAVAEEYCADGFVPAENADGTFGVEKASVASINGTKYTSLAEAVAAAQAGDEIVLIADVKTTDGVVITDKNLTIDLNGKTYTVTEGASTNNRNFKINGTSVVTVKNGTMVAAGQYSSGAYGTIRTEGTANVTLTGLKLYNYRGNGLNIKACAGTTVTIENTEIYANYGGGIESAGGTIVVNDGVTVKQEGMYTAPYNSMAISVNGGGKVTVNGGTFSTECITAEEANNQGTSHGPWVAGVLNSGGTLIINGGTFSNDNFGENSLATYARGAILADTKAKVEINGGTFNVLKNVIDIQNNLGDANNNPSVVLAGGTYSADPRISAQYGSSLITLADGYVAVENNGVWTVEQAVAQIGDVEYATLQEAIDACEGENNVITLLSNITFESDLKDAGKGYFNIADGKKVVLDMNGKTINVTDKSTGNFIVFYNYGEFTVANGTINLTSTNDREWNAESAIFLNRGGIFNIENGIYTHNGGTDMAFVVDNSGNYYGDATTNIYERTLQRNTVTTKLTSSYIAIRNRMEQNSHGASGEAILNVHGGTISGTSRAIWAQAASTSETAPATGEINVKGGNIGLIDTPRSTGAVSMTTISGGTVSAFKGEVGELTVTEEGTLNEVTLFTAAGETVNDYAVNEDGLYVQAVAQVGETKYTDLQEAIKAAAPAGTVEILADVVVDEWIMFSETLNISSGQIITMNIDGLTINGNGKTVTIKSIESASNGNRLFYDATKLNINYWTIKYADGVAGGIGLTSGTINNVTIEGGAGVFPGTGNITISECNFKTSGHCIYFEEERDNLVVTKNTFELPADANVILLRGDVEFTDNIVVSGRTVNVVSGSPEVTGNDFGQVRFKVYNEATATIEENTINNLVFNKTDVPTESTFTDNTLSAEAQAAIDALPVMAGDGTEANPYTIGNLAQLKAFRDDVNAGNTYQGKYVVLAADIDLNNEEWTPIGNKTNQFQGYFDGNNKTISNLKVTGNTSHKGFFGYIKGTGMSATTTPSVKDLTLDGVNVNVEGDGNYVGGLAGQAYTCNITKVTVKGNVSGVRYVGGLVGHVYTYFKDCHFIGNASCSFDALGGIAGAGDCRAYDCSVIGDVTGSNWVGGIVGNGQEGTSAVRCYVKGDVKTSTNWYFGVGGIAGVAGHGYSSSEFKNNYFDGEVYLEGEKVPAMIIGIVNAENNETINATIEGNSWNTTYYDVNIPVYVTAEAPQNGTTENWIAGASEELTKPRNNNLIMLESDLQYVTEEDYVIMSFSEVTEEQVEQALINNAVAKIGETTYTTLQKALDAAAAGTGNVTVEIIKDIDLTNVDWNPVTVSAPGYPVVTVNGNNKTITGLNDMLFAGTWAGNSGLIIKDLTIKNSAIVNDKDDAKGTVGVGAFIGYPQASATITLDNCHLKNSSVEGGHWTGGLIGMAGGYNGEDGPVFMNLTIKGCSVTGSTITGKGSVGGIIGHGSCAAWTSVDIDGTTVSDNTITSTGSSNIKAGAIMGTIGAAGQPTTANGETKTGGMSVSATVAENTVKSNGTEITTIYGRQGTETGMLYVAGGTYDNYPIEEGVAYAAPAAGYKIEQNTDGTYGVVVDPAYGKVAKIGDTYYETLAEAYNAATDGQTITLLNNITLGEKFVIAQSITLDGNGKTLTYTGTDRAIDVPNDANANIDVTIKNLTVVATTANRGLNYNENGKFNVEGVTVTIGENVDGYAINFPGMADNAQVTIKDSKLTSRNPLNIWGENMVIDVYDSEIISVDNSTTYDYAAIQLNNEIPTVGPNGAIANGTVVNVYGGTITALNDENEPSNVVANATETGVVNISDETVVTGKVLDYVANIGGAYFGSLQAAVNAIEKQGYNSPIVIMKSFATSETATVKNGLNVTIDLNGKTITVTDETEKNFEAIKNQGTLTIKDSSADKTGKITVTATTNSGWNRYSAVIANTVGGKLTVDGGTLEHLGGTDMAYGIDNLTNGKGTYAETVINGGYIKSTYRGIRQFLNGTEAQNILTVNGGTIEGANKSVWMQDPNTYANTGTLTVGENATLEGDVYLYVTPNSTSWPVEVSIAAGALAEGSEIITGNVPAGYELQQDADLNYVVNQVVAKIGDVLYATVTEAINAAENGGTVQLLALTIDEYVAPWATDTQHTSEKSITIIGAENFGTTMTGGLYLGYDDSQCREHTIVVKGINFTGKGILVASQQNVTVEGNKFTDITDHVASSGSAGKNAISIIGKDVIATVKNNVITTTASVGIDLRNILTATVDGNTVTGTQHNSMQIQNASANSSAEIANNRFFDWGKSGEGRAMRINQIVTADVNNNVMINVNAPEEFVKITEHTTAKIDENYWNGANPTSSNTPAYFLAEGVQVHNYYAAYDEESNTLIDLVTIEGAGETLEIFYTAAGEVTEQANAAYSLMFTVTDYANNEVSVKIGNKKPAQNSAIHLVTPETVEFDNVEFDVTSVADNGFNGTRFKTITISKGVRTLGTKALANMYDLTSVVFPSTLVSVGDNCFHGYGDSHKIKSITSYAVEAPAASGNWQTVPFQQCIADVAVLIVPNAVSYEEYATAPGWSRFYEEPNGGLINHIIGIGTELEIAGKDNKYTMIATITSMNPMECSIKIGQKPASNSNAELVIPTSVDFVESIEGFDFTVTSIPNNAFSTCYNFTGNLEIPATVKTIGNSAFLQAYYNTLNVGKLTLNEGLETILNSAFTLSYFDNENLVIPTTVTTIGSHAFNATNMSGTLTVQNNIPGGFNGFAGSLFTKVVVEEGVTSIVDSSSKGVFSNMSKLETVILPSTLEEIGVAAFSKDHAITTITINATVPPTVQNANVFEQEVYSNATLFVPDHAAKKLYKEANVWEKFANISTPIITQTTQLSAGWNWFSAYVETDLASLQSALVENGVQISSQTGFSTNFDGNWMGSLTTVSSTNMYNIYSNAETNVEISGELIDYNSVEITLHNKWNWISYPMNQNMSINYALNKLTPSNFDQISSQEAFATYFEGTGWVGSLLTLESGKGYKYYSQCDTEKSFTYTYTSTRGETKANITAENNHWVPNASQYANNMTMTAMVDVEGGDYEVAAFVDGEVRGSARPIYVEALDSYMLFLTIHGEGVEEMTFKFYDLATGEEYALNDRMNYSDDAIVGSLKEPYMFNRGTTGIGEASLSDINIYPNPTTTGTEINLQATCDKVEVFNALGVKVAEYQNVDSIDALETAGIYVIRITNGGNVKHCSLVVK